uniref:uncharacterized protein LOC122783710 isoform X2 n=1 Tax=Solea senegalensis TaxID=28829 RepID=UPI001CD83F80|nr:uncharacterized protein LOC122783710 isoform X2 [Solea senegalensis]
MSHRRSTKSPDLLNLHHHKSVDNLKYVFTASSGPSAHISVRRPPVHTRPSTDSNVRSSGVFISRSCDYEDEDNPLSQCHHFPKLPFLPLYSGPRDSHLNSAVKWKVKQDQKLGSGQQSSPSASNTNNGNLTHSVCSTSPQNICYRGGKSAEIFYSSKSRCFDSIFPVKVLV